MAKKEFNVDKFIKNTTVFFICIICLLGCVMVLYRMKHPAKYVDSYSGTLSINQNNLDTFMNQISIIDPILSTSEIDAKKLSKETMLYLATDKIIADNKDASTLTFNKGNLLNYVISIIGIKDYSYYPEEYTYLNYHFKLKNDQYVMTKVGESTSGYEFASDNYTLEGKVLTFTVDILYYKDGNKYYTDSTKKNFICEGDSSCVIETQGYISHPVQCIYYINDDNFTLRTIKTY